MSAYILKVIALTTMIIDHLGAVFPENFPFIFRVIGRISFPIYAYLIAEGCRHTRSMPKYLARLGVFAVISQIPFTIAINYYYRIIWDASFFLNVFIYETNIFYTFFIAALCILVCQKFRKNEKIKPFSLPLMIPVTAAGCFLADKIGADYGWEGVTLVILMYVIPKKKPRVAAMAAMCCVIYRSFFTYSFTEVAGLIARNISLLRFDDFYGMMMLFASLLAVVPAALYNGERGPDSKTMKWAFYIIYPFHLLLFGMVRIFIY